MTGTNRPRDPKQIYGSGTCREFTRKSARLTSASAQIQPGPH